MLLVEILRLAFSSLTSNKLRSSLTVLGIAVGVFSVMVKNQNSKIQN